jgi:hypothetical protein
LRETVAEAFLKFVESFVHLWVAGSTARVPRLAPACGLHYLERPSYLIRRYTGLASSISLS